LRNAIDHAVIVARGGVIGPQHLPDPLPDTTPSKAADLTLDQQISQLIRQWAEQQLAGDNREEGELYQEFLDMVEPALLQIVLAVSSDQCAVAARQLGMHRTTLRKKLDEYGLGD
jgi:two-component system nitrogen regulation response regulator GlnG